jgi:cytoskeletal protein CcmA (bactofilin family)
MFNKNTEKLESFVGVNSSFKGEFHTKGTLKVDGSIEGNISADWVIIGEKALIKGDVTGRGIIVGGRVEGNIRAKEIVELRNKAYVTGEIVTIKLTILEGAVFDGRSTMQKGEFQADGSKVVELQAKEKSG